MAIKKQVESNKKEKHEAVEILPSILLKIRESTRYSNSKGRALYLLKVGAKTGGKKRTAREREDGEMREQSQKRPYNGSQDFSQTSIEEAKRAHENAMSMLDQVETHNRSQGLGVKRVASGHANSPKAMAPSIFSSEKKKATGTGQKERSPFSNRSPGSDTSMLN